MRKLTLLIVFFLLHSIVRADNWDYIRTSGEYYYGTGTASTEVEADKTALADLISQIATHVSSDFTQIDDVISVNGSVDHKSRVLNCVKTYSQSALTNTEKMVTGREPEVTVRRYIKRTELQRVFNNRIAKAKDMIMIAEDALGRNKIDMALQYYYWAYSLIRSVQFPDEVKDSEGRVLTNLLPVLINDILSCIDVKYEKRDGDDVDLLFYYNKQPISSLDFSYSDGRVMCQGTAKDGRGSIQMIPGYITETYHLDIEYEYKEQARGDAEMESVLDVITRKVLDESEKRVNAKDTRKTTARTTTDIKTGINLTPQKSQLAQNEDAYLSVITSVLEAIKARNVMGVAKHFTTDGFDVYNKLIAYGKGRVIGTPNIKFFKGTNNTIVARGVQMSFSFVKGTKKTFVEDVVFTFNQDKKIENVAFGLGQTAENDILCRYAPGWKDDTRELLMEFMENYKTAYCLKRIDYIRDIFADDAVIIVGNVVRRNQNSKIYNERNISIDGQNVITTNRYTKDQYLKNLQRCFHNNEFINIRFGKNDIQWLEKYENEERFAIQISQEYNSSTYADKGFLFLLVDMTDHNAPQIKIRTWQPHEVDMNKLYNAGDFYND